MVTHVYPTTRLVFGRVVTCVSKRRPRNRVRNTSVFMEPPADEEQPRKKRSLKANREHVELAAHADAKKKGKSKANTDNASIGQVAAVAKILDGKARELSEHDREIANKYMRDKAYALHKKASEFAHDTGSSVVLIVQPNDAFGMDRNMNGTFPAAYVNSFMAEEHGPSLGSKAVDTLREHIFDHVHELPNVGGCRIDDKQLLKVANKLGCGTYAKEQLDKAERMREEAFRMRLLEEERRRSGV